MAEDDDHRRLALQAIYVRSSSTSLADDFHPNVPGQQLAPLFRTDYQGRVTCNATTFRNNDGTEQKALWCAFMTRFEFVYARPKADGSLLSEDEIESNPIARVQAEIVATYILNDENFPAQDTLNAWGRHSVLIHTWPYWREFCHNALLRMGLPVTIIPLIQIEQRIEDSSHADP